MATNLKTKEMLKQALADSYALYLKTQNYHWNVEGQNFKALHELFEEHYTDLANAIDEIAERIRALGDKVSGNFKYFHEKTNIKSGNEANEAQAMVKDLIASHDIIIDTFKKVVKAANIDDDNVSEDIAVQRLSFHEKSRWMLTSSL